MLCYAQIVDWMFDMSLTFFSLALVIALYYVFLKNSDRGRD
jgi:NO-binding membrane sensor protein with MHYT domain